MADSPKCSRGTPTCNVEHTPRLEPCAPRLLQTNEQVDRIRDALDALEDRARMIRIRVNVGPNGEMQIFGKSGLITDLRWAHDLLNAIEDEMFDHYNPQPKAEEESG